MISIFNFFTYAEIYGHFTENYKMAFTEIEIEIIK